MNPKHPCPWDNWDPGTVQFCEERLCAWIAEPSNTWSSLAYVIIGLITLWAWRKGPSIGVAVSVANIMIGIGSFFFHASGTFAGEVVDQIGMFMLSVLILVSSAAQAQGRSSSWAVKAYVIGVVVSTAAILVVRPLGIPIFAVQLLIGLGWQLRLWKQVSEPEKEAFKIFIAALGLFFFSLFIWALDITGIVCDPTNHFITGHAIWHVCNAVCIWRIGVFYRERFQPGSGSALA